MKGHAPRCEVQQWIKIGQRPLFEGLARYYRLLRSRLQTLLPTTLERKCDSDIQLRWVVAAARYTLPLVDAAVADRKQWRYIITTGIVRTIVLSPQIEFSFLVHVTKIRKAYNLLSLYNGHCSGLLR